MHADLQPPKTFSLPALGFILACLLLASALAFVTWQNFNREENLMETFLLTEGQTLIRAFEAGARTSMMMGSRSGNLTVLAKETAREASIAYVVIFDETGEQVTAAGDYREKANFPPIPLVLSNKKALTRATEDRNGNAVFEVAKLFSPLNIMPQQMMKMMQRMHPQGGDYQNQRRQVIYLGFYTAAFEAARHEDIKQSLILLAILFLLGSGGLYALFIVQKSQATKVALENMELYTDNLIHSMPAGLISIDTQRRIVSANRNAQDIFGRTEAEMLGQRLQQLVGDKECPIAPLLKAGEEFVDQPMECLQKGGEEIPLKVSASRLQDRDGRFRGMVLILRDQREIRAMEQALERSRRHAALGLMAAGIAHEIRNPLGTLRGFAQYFSRSKSGDDKAHEYAELMIGEVDRLNRTVSALLQFSRPREAEIVPADFDELLQRTIVFLQPDADNQQVQLKLAMANPELSWPVDGDLLQQVLLNLLQNSLAATSAGGEIEVGAEQHGESLHLWVADTGCGLTTDDQAKMFDPFFTTRKEGTGLGLAMVQQIVEQHNGRVTVETQPGQGTRITLILPKQRGES